MMACEIKLFVTSCNDGVAVWIARVDSKESLGKYTGHRGVHSPFGLNLSHMQARQNRIETIRTTSFDQTSGSGSHILVQLPLWRRRASASVADLGRKGYFTLFGFSVCGLNLLLVN